MWHIYKKNDNQLTDNLQIYDTFVYILVSYIQLYCCVLCVNRATGVWGPVMVPHTAAPGECKEKEVAKVAPSTK